MSSAMDSASWDRRYGGRELVWTAEPNRFLVAETETSRRDVQSTLPAARDAMRSGSLGASGR